MKNKLVKAAEEEATIVNDNCSEYLDEQESFLLENRCAAIACLVCRDI